MLIKINFMTENINYTETSTETVSGGGWNITADLKLVPMYILPGGPLRRILVRLYGRRASVTKILHHSYRSHS